MKILVCTAIQRDANQRPFYFPRAIESILSLRWNEQLDHYLPSGDDDTPDNPLTRKYRAARWLALDNSYDALFLCESDMIIPPDALERLAALNTPIAYGLYAFRHGKQEWSAYTRLDEHGAQSISADPKQACSQFGRVMEVAGVGHGCALIRRPVLECFDFRNRVGTYPDWAFAIDAQYYGFKQVCDLGVVCGHINRDGSVLWPDPDADHLVRVERN